MRHRHHPGLQNRLDCRFALLLADEGGGRERRDADGENRQAGE